MPQQTRVPTGASEPLLINTVFRDTGPLCTLQMLLIRVLLIFPLRAVAPSAVLFWIFKWYEYKQRPALTTRRGYSLLRLLTQASMRSWLTAEVVFLIFYWVQRRRLNAEKVRPPPLPPGKALEVLQRCLSTVYDIQGGGRIGRLGALSCLASPNMSRQSSAEDLMSLMPQASGEATDTVETLLRHWEKEEKPPQIRAADNHEPSRSRKNARTSGASPMIGYTWDRMDQAQVLALKWAEISGWFLGAPAVDIRRGNVEEWVSWAFFNAPSKETLNPSRQAELDKLVNYAEEWAELRLPIGYNPKVKCMRLSFDPIPSAHRPLVYYLVTGLAMPIIQEMILSRMGFVSYKSGTVTYWHRPGKVDGIGVAPPPLVFCHGIGISMLPYMRLLTDLLRWSSDAPRRDVFLVSVPNIAMRIKDEAHSMGEMVGCVSDMLDSWDIRKAHFVGHSFGSVVISWMVKREPSRVLACTFLDPVCFMLAKPDVAYNFMYRAPRKPTQLLLHYFVSKELYISHSLARHFFWYQCILWPEEFPPGAPILVVLSGKDSIVPAHSVRRYLAAFQQKQEEAGSQVDLEVLFFPNLGHGEMSFGPRGAEATAQILDKLFEMEMQIEGQVD